MASRRILKAAEAIREVVSMAILTEIRDPRVQNVTVTGVEVAPDMRSAKVFVSVMGDEGKQQLCLRGLSNSAGFLQAKIAKRIDTRYTPRLSFELDLGVKHSLEVGRILHDLAVERQTIEADRQPPESQCQPPEPECQPRESQRQSPEAEQPDANEDPGEQASSASNEVVQPDSSPRFSNLPQRFDSTSR